MMVSTQRTTIDAHIEESEEQVQLPLLTVMETAGGLVSWEQLF